MQIADNLKNASVRNNRATVFSFIFSNEKALADLYCGLGKNVAAEDIEYLNLDDLLQRVGRYNDAAFRTKDNRLVVFVEHQSTLNRNMPFRFLEYFVFVIKYLLSFMSQDRFNTKAMDLPQVEFYVAYNGRSVLRDEDKNLMLDLGDIYVKVKVIDIRYDALPDMDADNTLVGYAYFVDVFESQKKQGKSPYEAHNIAMAECIKEGYLTDIFTRKECVDVFREIYYSYDDQLRDEGKAEGEAKGKAEGKAEGMLEAALRLLKRGKLFSDIKSDLMLSEEEVVLFEERAREQGLTV